MLIDTFSDVLAGMLSKVQQSPLKGWSFGDGCTHHGLQDLTLVKLCRHFLFRHDRLDMAHYKLCRHIPPFVRANQRSQQTRLGDIAAGGEGGGGYFVEAE